MKKKTIRKLPLKNYFDSISTKWTLSYLLTFLTFKKLWIFLHFLTRISFLFRLRTLSRSGFSSSSPTERNFPVKLRRPNPSFCPEIPINKHKFENSKWWNLFFVVWTSFFFFLSFLLFSVQFVWVLWLSSSSSSSSSSLVRVSLC